VADGIPLEVINWRTVVSGPTPSLDLRRCGVRPIGEPAALKGRRPVYFQEYGTYRATPVYDRYQLRPGDTVTGPAVVEERESTAVLGPSAIGVVDECSNLVVRIAHDA
jgi:N-methylhydantoinase A